MKILSIVVPTYNAAQFLDKGLSSMILDSEHMEKLEVIVVNDGSPDNSVEIAQKYVNQYPGTFCILNKENGGHGSGINAGSKQATGKYFKVVDADDWVDTEALRKTIDLLETVDCDVLMQSYRTHDISKNGEEQSLEVNYFEEESHPDHIYSLKEVTDHWSECFAGMGLHGLTYNTKFYLDLHYDLCEKVFYEDQEYNTIPLCNAQSVCLSEIELYVYRIGDVNQSVSTQSSLNRVTHYETVIKKELAYEPMLKGCPDGAKEHWERKLSKFLCDYYRLLLIKSDDKKKYRPLVDQMNAYMQKNNPGMFAMVSKKYKVFKALNKLHMSDVTYERTVLKLLEARKK